MAISTDRSGIFAYLSFGCVRLKIWRKDLCGIAAQRDTRGRPTRQGGHIRDLVAQTLKRLENGRSNLIRSMVFANGRMSRNIKRKTGVISQEMTPAYQPSATNMNY
ncbi:hypothetical protein [Paraburkholderia sp. BCC1885]|uniref:hypothetical protein n=1 Tax=Paraburkholderia sp. BCC1885 TaxID=2562669 RepID=UPI001183BF60|nr:hypothetical protein [Paraburkholderia sp. BCC1885]